MTFALTVRVEMTVYLLTYLLTNLYHFRQKLYRDDLMGKTDRQTDRQTDRLTDRP